MHGRPNTTAQHTLLLHAHDEKSDGVQTWHVAGAGFARLQSLNLGGNQITQWASVDALDVFPALSELRLSGNPLLPATAADARFEVQQPLGVPPLLGSTCSL